MSDKCPCCSGKLFDRCCARFLNSEAQAKTAEQLMRSRFSAYKLGSYGEYLFRTWALHKRIGLCSVELSQKSCEWLRLEVHDKSQNGDEAWVRFTAWYREGDGEVAMNERSYFKREKGRWYYVDGELG